MYPARAAALDRYVCGPLDVGVAAATPTLRAKIAETLELYNVAWGAPRRAVRLDARADDVDVALGAGAYLACQRMHVDRDDAGRLVATARSGATCIGDGDGTAWTMVVPRREADLWVLTDVEHLLSLVLTTGWRAAGWVPLHAGTIARADRCAIVCAESGGGKTTLTAALVRQGWQTLGDDKLLLRVVDAAAHAASGARRATAGHASGGAVAAAQAELRALVHTFNLHPRTRAWFPEVGDLERLPRYSEWTEKRKVRPQAVWPGATRAAARPTHLVELHRAARGAAPVRVAPLAPGAVLATLLRQTVIPSEPAVARAILGTVAAAARALAGLRVEVADDAYADPACLTPLVEAILA